MHILALVFRHTGREIRQKFIGPARCQLTDAILHVFLLHKQKRKHFPRIRMFLSVEKGHHVCSVKQSRLFVDARILSVWKKQNDISFKCKQENCANGAKTIWDHCRLFVASAVETMGERADDLSGRAGATFWVLGTAASSLRTTSCLLPSSPFN